MKRSGQGGVPIFVGVLVGGAAAGAFFVSLGGSLVDVFAALLGGLSVGLGSLVTLVVLFRADRGVNCSGFLGVIGIAVFGLLVGVAGGFFGGFLGADTFEMVFNEAHAGVGIGVLCFCFLCINVGVGVMPVIVLKINAGKVRELIERPGHSSAWRRSVIARLLSPPLRLAFGHRSEIKLEEWLAELAAIESNWERWIYLLDLIFDLPQQAQAAREATKEEPQ